MSLPEAASHSLAVLSALPVRIRAPSGLNTAALTSSRWAKEAMSLPEVGIPELGGFVRTRRQDPSTIRTKRHGFNRILMSEGGDQIDRGRIPQLGGVICASRQDPSTVGTKRRSANPILMGKGGDQLAQGHIPELGGLVRARRQDPGTVGTKRRPLNPILMGKGGDQLARGSIPELSGLVRSLPSGSEHRPD